jgi:hypothetical protein
MMSFEVEKLSGCLGARMSGLVIVAKLEQADTNKLRKALFVQRVMG